eukprot:m.122133 g.122133  ORF g.122133 m.122133 type:complete len:292 (-) comp11096_c4_seq1:216-1091(-)
MYAHSMIDHHTARPSTQTKVILLVGCGLVLVGMWRSWSLGAHPTQPFEYTGKGGSWESFSSKDALTPLFDAHMRPRRFQVAESEAHGADTAVLHRGVWLAVMSRPAPSNGLMKVLLLKRPLEAATCPGVWGLVGSHSLPHETWIETAQRALYEQLGLSREEAEAQQHVLLRGAHGEESVLMRSDYNGESTDKERELQATALVAVVLPDDLVEKIAPVDKEAGVEWVTYGDMESMLAAASTGAKDCSTDIAKLQRVALDRLHEYIPQQNNPREVNRRRHQLSIRGRPWAPSV